MPTTARWPLQGREYVCTDEDTIELKLHHDDSTFTVRSLHELSEIHSRRIVYRNLVGPDEDGGTLAVGLGLWEWMPAREDAKIWGEAALPTAAALFEETHALIKARPSGKPFFAMVTIMEVHEYSETEDGPVSARSFPDDPDGPYLRAVQKASREVGRFVDALRSNPDTADTLFVILSDHGEGLTSHPTVDEAEGHGMHVYPSVVRVPLILHHRNRLPAGRIVRQGVRLLDVTPTILEYVGVAPLAGAEGRSLVPQTRTPASPAPMPDAFFVETLFQGQESLGVYTPGYAYFAHRVPLGGQAREELLPRGGNAGGKITDWSQRDPGRFEGLRTRLLEWENDHPRRDAAPAPTLDPKAQEQLRALGYVR